MVTTPESLALGNQGPEFPWGAALTKISGFQRLSEKSVCLQCRPWTCKWRWVLQPARRVGWTVERTDQGRESTFTEGLCCLPKWILKVRDPRCGLEHKRGSTIAAEGGETAILQIIWGRLPAAVFGSERNFSSKRGKSCLSHSEGKSELFLLQGRNHLYTQYPYWF